MASSATVGTAVIKLAFDGKSVKAELNGVTKEVESSGNKSGTAYGNAWTVAAGSLISKGVSKIAGVISNQMDDAIYRADTLERFPKVMEMMGYNADDAAKSVERLRKGVEEVPTSLADVVSLTQRLTTMTKDVDVATDWALAISDAMLLTTGDVNEASRGMTQFLQVLAKGKPVGNDWNTILEVASPVMEELAHHLGYTSAALEGDFYTALQKGTLSTEEMMAALLDLDKNGSETMSSLSELARTSAGGIKTAMTTLRQSISNAMVAIIQEIGFDNIRGAIESIKGALVGLVKTIGSVVTFITSNWTIIQPIFMAILSFITTLGMIVAAKKVYMGLSSLFTLIATNPILLVISGVIFAITELIMHFDTVKAVAETVFSAITDTIGIFGSWITETFTGIWDTVTNLFGGLADFFGSIFGGAWERVKNVFSTGGQIFMGIVDGITQAFRKVVNAIITGINHVVALPFNAINGFLETLKGIDILGVKPFGWIGTIDVPQIPLLAAGGLVDGATAAVIGEAGREAVLPLDNNTDNWAGLLAATLVDEMEQEHLGGTGVNIGKQEFIINNQMDAEEIGRVMMQSIRRAA